MLYEVITGKRDLQGDPVDGIPFIATEWIEGTVLEGIIQQRPLPRNNFV